jgi:hypothetical protein
MSHAAVVVFAFNPRPFCILAIRSARCCGVVFLIGADDDVNRR